MPKRRTLGSASANYPMHIIEGRRSTTPVTSTSARGIPNARWSSSGDVAGAAFAWDEGLRLGHPGWFHVQRAIAIGNGTGEALLQRWKEALPTNSDLLESVVALLFDLNRPADAVRLAREHLESSTLAVADCNDLLLALAEGSLTHGDPQEALKHLGQLSGKPARAPLLKARALLEVGRVDDALVLLEPYIASGALAPMTSRLVIARCRKAKGEPVDTSFIDAVKSAAEVVEVEERERCLNFRIIDQRARAGAPLAYRDIGCLANSGCPSRKHPRKSALHSGSRSSARARHAERFDVQAD
ncbi:MAG TPA: hypothetical protein VIM73_12440 [Polyangiaceae bacterium]